MNFRSFWRLIRPSSTRHNVEHLRFFSVNNSGWANPLFEWGPHNGSLNNKRTEPLNYTHAKISIHVSCGAAAVNNYALGYKSKLWTHNKLNWITFLWEFLGTLISAQDCDERTCLALGLNGAAWEVRGGKTENIIGDEAVRRRAGGRRWGVRRVGGRLGRRDGRRGGRKQANGMWEQSSCGVTLGEGLVHLY